MSSSPGRVYLFDLVASLAKAVDLVNPRIAEHHTRVAYIAYQLACESNLPYSAQYQLALAGALHDIGCFSMQERLDVLEFEDVRPYQHAIVGARLLETFEPFRGIAHLVRYHHMPWADGKGTRWNGEVVPDEAHLLHLADRIAVLVQRDDLMLSQVAAIRTAVDEQSGRLFNPEHVEVFHRLAMKEYFWLDLSSHSVDGILRRKLRRESIELDQRGLVDFSRLVCRLIDFKSEFTATHSSGVAAVAVCLAELIGFSEEERETMRVAAYLHDLGKLAVPSEIIEKPARLNEEERNIMLSHAYFTYQVLEEVEGFEIIADWGALHQERLDGSGYPFHRTAKELSLGARIMAVADVFTALTENRPYRRGLDHEKTLGILRRQGEAGELDTTVIRLVEAHYDEIDGARALAQRDAILEYRSFVDGLDAVG
ncbi:MAG: HD domain-containing protein [Candidatus Hydrogenedentes bacterium]|nr:HD domain-containing protein [Candidatus Hydrogenedentota bacterium]